MSGIRRTFGAGLVFTGCSQQWDLQKVRAVGSRQDPVQSAAGQGCAVIRIFAQKQLSQYQFWVQPFTTTAFLASHSNLRGERNENSLIFLIQEKDSEDGCWPQGFTDVFEFLFYDKYHV